MEQTISKHTLFEYLAGRSTPLEKQVVDEWLKKEENREQFHRWLLEWELQSPQYIPATDTAFAALLDRLETGAAPVGRSQTSLPANRGFPLRQLLAAASVAAVLCVGAWLLRDSIYYRTYETGYGQTTAFLLSDGSHVALNANSRLRVPRFGWSRNVREVHLEGEAEFSVRHTATHQRFVVRLANDIRVEVLGTEFTVFARKRGTRVALNRGKIRLDYTQGAQPRQLLMKPGELAAMSRQGNLTLRKAARPEALSAWKAQRMVFDQTSVQEICALLEENFGVIVRIEDPDIAGRTISGNFKAQTAEDLLSVLKGVLNLQITRENASLLLRNQD